MRFNLVDRIVDFEPGHGIRTVKNLTLGEEYLADHFPSFPVMPGVLMLQMLVETGAWYLRIRDDFRYSVILLREVKNVKYGTFMEPGRRMTLNVEPVEEANGLATFKGKGEVQGQLTVSAKFTLIQYNLRDRNPALAPVDDRIVAHLRTHYLTLQAKACPRAVAAPSANGPLDGRK